MSEKVPEQASTPGKRRWRVVVALCALAVGLAAVAFWPEPKEPEYKGKKLSYWMGITLPPGVTLKEEDYAEAIRRIGTNGFPYVLKRMRYRTPNWRIKLYGKLPGRLQVGFIGTKIYGPDPEWVVHRLPNYFRVLGPEAAPVVPELIRILQDPKSPALTVQLAMVWLRAIGEPARPSLPQL